MRLQLSVILFFVSVLVIAQKTNTENDSILHTSNDEYIQKHHQQLNISFEVSNERTNYFIPLENETASVKTNLNIRYAFVFSYKFISVRLGIRPPVSNEEEKNKGKSKTFRLRVKLLFDKWSHQLEYNRHQGYFVDNTSDFNISSGDDKFHIQFPNLITQIFQGTTLYKINDNYSLRAVESQTEIQLKSVGTFMPGIDYKYYEFKGADEVKISPEETIIRDDYSDVNGFSFIANAGYYYTFVHNKHWFANIFAVPGVGIDFYKSKTHTIGNINENSDNDFFFSFKTGLSVGYNGEKIFAGAGYDYYYTSEKFNNYQLHVRPSRDKFHVYIGYRFKAPKQLRKPVNYIEDKVPILKDDEGI